MRIAYGLACGIALSSAGAASGPKWVPLKSIAPGSVNEPKASAPIQQPSAPAAAPTQEPLPTVRQTAPLTAVQTAAPSVVESVSAGNNTPLQITCFGGGTANKAEVATAFGGGTFSGFGATGMINGNFSGSSTIIGTRQQGFEDQVDIRLFSGDDRIRLPRTILPVIHGGQAGWFKLKDVVADARSIRASAAINFMSNPKIYIDRVTGTISISGRAGDYTGQCQAVATTAAPKF